MISPERGELVPVGGGDSIPLLRNTMTMGRRDGCDICLDFPNVSGMHCELVYHNGHWLLRDLGSKNGIKVNGMRVHKKYLMPDDVITIAKRHFTIKYTPIAGEAIEEFMEESEEVMDRPLLEKAGLMKAPRSERGRRQELSDDD